MKHNNIVTDIFWLVDEFVEQTPYSKIPVETSFWGFDLQLSSDVQGRVRMGQSFIVVLLSSEMLTIIPSCNISKWFSPEVINQDILTTTRIYCNAFFTWSKLPSTFYKNVRLWKVEWPCSIIFIFNTISSFLTSPLLDTWNCCLLSSYVIHSFKTRYTLFFYVDSGVLF